MRGVLLWACSFIKVCVAKIEVGLFGISEENFGLNVLKANDFEIFGAKMCFPTEITKDVTIWK